jgi:hypothetical protein
MTARKQRYIVSARRWENRWELEVPGVGDTQSRSLGGAEGAARAYIARKLDIEPPTFEVVIAPMIDEDLHDMVLASRKGAAELLEFQRAIKQRAIDTATALEKAGYKRQDIAVLMGVSNRRISQVLPHKFPAKSSDQDDHPAPE